MMEHTMCFSQPHSTIKPCALSAVSFLMCRTCSCSNECMLADLHCYLMRIHTANSILPSSVLNNIWNLFYETVRMNNIN